MARRRIARKRRPCTPARAAPHRLRLSPRALRRTRARAQDAQRDLAVELLELLRERCAHELADEAAACATAAASDAVAASEGAADAADAAAEAAGLGAAAGGDAAALCRLFFHLAVEVAPPLLPRALDAAEQLATGCATPWQCA
eukprot:2700626-Prymnesium_polylepis.1